ncbi:MAG: DUF4114 domain-containing protein [Desulfobacteraceae bacterium]|nr:DUF4114 domain-containing protein [Desulfobacteraceae bacterium]
MKTLPKIFTLTVVAAFLFAGSAIAVPTTLYDINGIDGTQKYTDTGYEHVRLIDTDGNNDDSTAFLFLESTIFASDNTLGIYSFSEDNGIFTVGDTLEIFEGDDSPLKSATLDFNFMDGTVTNRSSGATANIGAVFGFYLTTPENGGMTYYSHSSLNQDGFDHLMLFDTRDNTVGDLLGSDVILAWEDLYGGGEQDFNDMVVGIGDVVVPTPEPATMLLLGSGLIGLAALRKKRYFRQ